MPKVREKTVRTQKTIHYNNKKYVGIKRNGCLNVKVAQTAKGQFLSAGTYNFETGSWSDSSRRCGLPSPVKKLFEEAFGL